MTEFKTEGQKLFEVNKENDTSAASSAGEKTDSDQTGSSDQDNKQTDNKDGATDDTNLVNNSHWKKYFNNAKPKYFSKTFLPTGRPHNKK